MVALYARASVAVHASREVSPHVDSGVFGVGHQRGGRDSLMWVGIACPPEQFGLIRRVMLA